MNKKNLPKAIRPEAPQKAPQEAPPVKPAAPAVAARPAPPPRKPAPVMAKAVVPETAEGKDRRARAVVVVKRLSLWSCAAGLIPIPLVDLAAVGGVQVEMLRRISKIYGVPFSENSGKVLIAG